MPTYCKKEFLTDSPEPSTSTVVSFEERLMTALRLGYCPYAMFYRDPEGKQNKTKEWTQFQRLWVRPPIINTTRKKVFHETR